jgi:hypothetical protein
MIERVEDWWPRLQGTVRLFEGVPFTWGETDCAMFACACIKATTGHDLGKTWRGIYKTRLASVARLRHRGHRTLESAAEAALLAIGAVEIDPRAARCGDIGINESDVLAVRMPPGFVARREKGDFALVKVSRAWAV